MGNLNLYTSKKNLSGYSLEELLGEVSVMKLNELDNGIVYPPEMDEWFGVITDSGIIAYFGTDSDAFRFRLDYINLILNS